MYRVTAVTEQNSYRVAGRELYKEERDELEGETRDVNDGGMEPFDALDGRETTQSQTRFLCDVWKKHDGRPNVVGVHH